MSMIHQIRVFMQGNKYLEKLVAPLAKTKILTKRRENIYMQRALGQVSAFKACYEAHTDKFEKLAQMLGDDFSRKTLQAIIDYRLNPRGGS